MGPRTHGRTHTHTQEMVAEAFTNELQLGEISMHRLELIGMGMRRVGPHGSGTVNLNCTKFLDFASSHGLRGAGSWFQHPQAHRWTWYSNAGRVPKEFDHVLIDGPWRMIQNCRVFRSAQFLNTNQQLVVATLKSHLKSRRMVSSQPRLDVGKLKDERVAEEFANRLSGHLGGLGALGGPEELWNAFKTTVLDVAGR